MKFGATGLGLALLLVGCAGETLDDSEDFGGASGGTSSAGSASAGGSGGSASGGALGSGGGSGGSAPITGAASLVSAELWEQLFPNRNALFTYEAFLAAAAYYPAFATSGSDELNRRELAAFFANVAHETTGGWADAPGGRYAWGLYYKEELGCENGQCPGYAQGDENYSCAPGKFYHGRGPIQISYCYNYGPAGEGIGVDLLAQPELVSSNGEVAFHTALWFWMTGTSGGKPTAHAAILGSGGFGGTINVINGIECNNGNPEKVQSRIAHFEHFVPMLGTTAGTPLGC